MIRRLIAACLLLLAIAPVAAQEARQAPEAATGNESKSLAVAARHMVVAAHPLAAETGRAILRQGGSAVDAAIATQLVLGLVEPQSSGLGGGAFLVHWDAAARSVRTYDGRETAPAAARPDRFLVAGKPMAFDAAMRSGLSVGVPGVMRMLELAHKRHGRLAWADLFAPAIKLAEQGFAISPRLSKLLKWRGAAKFSAAARGYFFDARGEPRPAGYVLKNPAYAETLMAIAAKGADAMHQGPIADAIVKAVAAAPLSKGDLTLADLAGYAALERPPVCVTYRQHQVCGMGSPSSGGIAVGQTLKLIEPFAGVAGKDARMTSQALHVVADAEKLAFADRVRYIADPEFVPTPDGLLDDSYLSERSRLIDPTRAMPRAEPGMPPGVAKKAFGIDATHEVAGTSHVSIVDDDGNAISMTTTIEGAFGSHIWAAGFLLNNELTDFSFKPTDKDGVAVANAIAGGKRPRSSMAPTIVLGPEGSFLAATGSPGGSRIILYVVKTLVALLDWGMDAQESAALANFGSEGGPFVFEKGASALWPGVNLASYGQAVADQVMTSGVNTILRRDDRLEGGSDPRREGVALGD